MQNSDDGRSVSVQVECWFESDGSIRVAIAGFPPPHLTVKNDPERPSGHPRLFRFLSQCLQKQGVAAPQL